MSFSFSFCVPLRLVLHGEESWDLRVAESYDMYNFSRISSRSQLLRHPQSDW